MWHPSDRLYRQAGLVTSEPFQGDDGPPPCAYCGHPNFKDLNSNGRVNRAECMQCGGVMYCPPSGQWQPELIGDPSNHPSAEPDPASGGVGGAANSTVMMDRQMRTKDDADHTAAMQADFSLWHTATMIVHCPYCQGKGHYFEDDHDWDADPTGNDQSAIKSYKKECPDCDGEGHYEMPTPEEDAAAEAARIADYVRRNPPPSIHDAALTGEPTPVPPVSEDSEPISPEDHAWVSGIIGHHIQHSPLPAHRRWDNIPEHGMPSFGVHDLATMPHPAGHTTTLYYDPDRHHIAIDQGYLASDAARTHGAWAQRGERTPGGDSSELEQGLAHEYGHSLHSQMTHQENHRMFTDLAHAIPDVTPYDPEAGPDAWVEHNRPALEYHVSRSGARDQFELAAELYAENHTAPHPSPAAAVALRHLQGHVSDDPPQHHASWSRVAAPEWTPPTFVREQQDARDAIDYRRAELRLAQNPVPGTHIWRGEVRHRDDLERPPSVGMHWTVNPDQIVSPHNVPPDHHRVMWQGVLDDPTNQIIPRSHPIWNGRHRSMDSEAEVRLQPGADIRLNRRYVHSGDAEDGSLPYPSRPERSSDNWTAHDMNVHVPVEHKPTTNTIDYSDVPGMQSHAAYEPTHSTVSREAADAIDHEPYTPEESDSRHYYAGGGSQYFNAHLRHGYPPYDEEIPDHIQRLDTMLGKSRLNKPVTVYRGMGDALDEVKEGDILHDKGFMSTSLDHNTARRLFSGSENRVLRFDVPAGHSAIAGTSGGDPEQEIILPRNMSVQVHHIEGPVYHGHLVQQHHLAQGATVWEVVDRTAALTKQAETFCPECGDDMTDTHPSICYGCGYSMPHPEHVAQRHEARFFHAYDPHCRVCAMEEGPTHTAAPIPEPYPNPYAGSKYPEGGQHGLHWYHGTHFDTDDEEAAHRLEPPETQTGEYGGRAGEHWNTDLGVHFAALHHVASDDFAKNYDNSRIAHTTIHMRNPAHFKDEWEMGKHAISFARSMGHRYLPTNSDAHEAWHAGDYEGVSDHDPQGRYYDYHDELGHDRESRKATAHIDEHGPEGHSLDEVDRYLAAHPDREEITQKYQQHLRLKGHDGIVYGNSYEGPWGNKCAIAFHDTPINVHHWEWVNGAPDNHEKHDPNQLKLFGGIAVTAMHPTDDDVKQFGFPPLRHQDDYDTLRAKLHSHYAHLSYIESTPHNQVHPDDHEAAEALRAHHMAYHVPSTLDLTGEVSPHARAVVGAQMSLNHRDNRRRLPQPTVTFEKIPQADPQSKSFVMADYHPLQQHIRIDPRTTRQSRNNGDYGYRDWFSASGDANGLQRTVSHEEGHHRERTMGIKKRTDMFRDISYAIPGATPFTHKRATEDALADWHDENLHHIINHIGTYAGANHHELAAELYAEYRHAYRPSEAAQVAGEHLEGRVDDRDEEHAGYPTYAGTLAGEAPHTGGRRGDPGAGAAVGDGGLTESRVVHPFDPNCHVCAETFEHTAAELPAAYPNPYAHDNPWHEIYPEPAGGPEGTHWYHGTHAPEHFDVPQGPTEIGTPLQQGQSVRHWNTDLGAHFTSLPYVAQEAARSQRHPENVRVAHATLHMSNPAHFSDEGEFVNHASQWAHEHGYGTPPSEDFKQEGWITTHPQRAELTERYRHHLLDQGHDGVVYGNSYEGPPGHASAIAFPETPVQVHHWDWVNQHAKVGATSKEADLDKEGRWHLTASWADVRIKAKSIRAAGGVRIAVASTDGVGGEVQGDHHVYETLLTFIPGSYKVGSWQCGCKWAAFAWGRSPMYRRFEGRMCSHALAMQYEAQARGMFGKTVQEDRERPSWLKPHSPVVVQYERPSEKHPQGIDLTRRAVPPGNMRRTFGSKETDMDYATLTARAVLQMVDNDPVAAIPAMSFWGFTHRQAQMLVQAELRGVTSVRRCPDCGAHVPDNARECPECGAHLDDAPEMHLAASEPGLNHTQDARRGYDAPDWHVGTQVPCGQCEGQGCGHCGGTGEVLQVGGHTVDAVPDQNNDEGDLMGKDGLGFGDAAAPFGVSAAKKTSGPSVAGVALKAADTGRVLMLQRGLDDPHDPAAGTWEFPGGHIEPDDKTSFHGGMREWEEEIGQEFPHGGVLHHVWTSPNGIYAGHVVVIPSERDVTMHDGRVITNPDDPKGDHAEQAAWWDIEHARKNPALRPEVKTGTPWKALRAAGDLEKTADYAANDPFSSEVSNPMQQPPHNDSQNPGSTGFMTRDDPESWSQSGPFGNRDDVPMAAYSAGLRTVIEPRRAPAPPIELGNVRGMWNEGNIPVVFDRNGTLHDHPEPALPYTDGTDDGVDPASRYSNNPFDPYYGDSNQDQGSINPDEDSLSANQYTAAGHQAPDNAAVADIVARFQASSAAGSLMSSGGAHPGHGDGMNIAAAAQAHLQKAALKDFNFHEQQELINEGARDNVRARNMDGLQIKGTHYEALEDLDDATMFA